MSYKSNFSSANLLLEGSLLNFSFMKKNVKWKQVKWKIWCYNHLRYIAGLMIFFCFFRSPKKANQIVRRISALASKMDKIANYHANQWLFVIMPVQTSRCFRNLCTILFFYFFWDFFFRRVFWQNILKNLAILGIKKKN